MRILFLGDVVGISGCSKLMNNLMNEIKSKNIDFVIVNGENSASSGVGLTKETCNDFYNCGVNVITSGNHIWDQKEILEITNKMIKVNSSNFVISSDCFLILFKCCSLLPQLRGDPSLYIVFGSDNGKSACT